MLKEMKLSSLPGSTQSEDVEYDRDYVTEGIIASKANLLIAAIKEDPIDALHHYTHNGNFAKKKKAPITTLLQHEFQSEILRIRKATDRVKKAEDDFTGHEKSKLFLHYLGLNTWNVLPLAIIMGLRMETLPYAKEKTGNCFFVSPYAVTKVKNDRLMFAFVDQDGYPYYASDANRSCDCLINSQLVNWCNYVMAMESLLYVVNLYDLTGLGLESALKECGFLRYMGFRKSTVSYLSKLKPRKRFHEEVYIACMLQHVLYLHPVEDLSQELENSVKKQEKLAYTIEKLEDIMDEKSKEIDYLRSTIDSKEKDELANRLTFEKDIQRNQLITKALNKELSECKSKIEIMQSSLNNNADLIKQLQEELQLSARIPGETKSEGQQALKGTKTENQDHKPTANQMSMVANFFPKTNVVVNEEKMKDQQQKYDDQAKPIEKLGIPNDLSLMVAAGNVVTPKVGRQPDENSIKFFDCLEKSNYKHLTEAEANKMEQDYEDFLDDFGSELAIRLVTLGNKVENAGYILYFACNYSASQLSRKNLVEITNEIIRSSYFPNSIVNAVKKWGGETIGDYLIATNYSKFVEKVKKLNNEEIMAEMINNEKYSVTQLVASPLDSKPIQIGKQSLPK